MLIVIIECKGASVGGVDITENWYLSQKWPETVEYIICIIELRRQSTGSEDRFCFFYSFLIVQIHCVDTPLHFSV